MNAVRTQSIRLFKGAPKPLGISGAAASGCLRQSNDDFRGTLDSADSAESELSL